MTVCAMASLTLGFVDIGCGLAGSYMRKKWRKKTNKDESQYFQGLSCYEFASVYRMNSVNSRRGISC